MIEKVVRVLKGNPTVTLAYLDPKSEQPVEEASESFMLFVPSGDDTSRCFISKLDSLSCINGLLGMCETTWKFISDQGNCKVDAEILTDHLGSFVEMLLNYTDETKEELN